MTRRSRAGARSDPLIQEQRVARRVLAVERREDVRDVLQRITYPSSTIDHHHIRELLLDLLTESASGVSPWSGTITGTIAKPSFCSQFSSRLTRYALHACWGHGDTCETHDDGSLGSAVRERFRREPHARRRRHGSVAERRSVPVFGLSDLHVVDQRIDTRRLHVGVARRVGGAIEGGG